MPRSVRSRSVPAKAPRPKIAVDVMISHVAWLDAIPDPVPLLRKAARRALVAFSADRGRSTIEKINISVALIDDRAMRKLNHKYRGKDKPTNVLSFGGEPDPAAAAGHLGDIAMALGVVRREAKGQGKTVADHLAHLMVHAMLHLLGYDHEDDDDAERMENVERKALAGMGIADPYQHKG